MPGRKEFAGAAAETTLVGGLTNSADSLQVTDASGYPVGTNPFVVVVGVETANEEKVLVQGRAGDTFTDLIRGYDDTTPVAHQPGERVRHVLDSDTVDEANAHVNTPTRDDHAQYLRTDGTRAPTGTSSLAGSPGNSAPGDSAAAGSALAFALADHTHGRESTETLMDLIFPAGTILEYSGSVLPPRFAWADGSEVNQADAPALWTAYGQTHIYGTPSDPLTKIKLPDRRDRVSVGKAASGARATLGATGGSHDAVVPTHTHTQNSHNHPQNSHNHTQNGHDHVQDPHRHAMDGDYGNRWLVSHGSPQNQMVVAAGQGYINAALTDIDLETANNQPTTATNQAETATNVAAAAVNQNAGESPTDKNLPKHIVCNFIVKVH